MSDKDLIKKMFDKIDIKLLDDDTKCIVRDSEIPKNTLFISDGDKRAYYGAKFYFNDKGELIDFYASF